MIALERLRFNDISNPPSVTWWTISWIQYKLPLEALSILEINHFFLVDFHQIRRPLPDRRPESPAFFLKLDLFPPSASSVSVSVARSFS